MELERLARRELECGEGLLGRLVRVGVVVRKRARVRAKARARVGVGVGLGLGFLGRLIES